MNVSDCDLDDIWSYKPLKRQRRVECTTTSINLPIQQRQSNTLKSHGFQLSSTTQNDESSSSELEDVLDPIKSRKNEDVKNIPSSQQETTSCGSSISKNQINKHKKKTNSKNIIKKRTHKNLTNESSISPEKISSKKNFMKTNITEFLANCPVCQISSAIFFYNQEQNIKKKWFSHISSCLVPKNLKECSHGLNCAVQEEEHYKNFQHSSLAQLRANMSPNSEKTSSQSGEIKLSMTEEFKERNNTGNVDSLPILQNTPVKRETTSVTCSSSESPLQIEGDDKKTDIAAFKRLFSSDSFKTSKKNTARSPAKCTPIKKIANKSPLFKDLSQQTLMYDFNKKELVLTPNKSTLQASETLSSPLHTPKKQVCSIWESLSVRKPNPPGSNSNLLSALNKDDSCSQSSQSCFSFQRNKSHSLFALDKEHSEFVYSEMLPTPMIMPSKSQQSSTYSESKSLGKSKSDKSHVTALFLSSDSDDDIDLKKNKTDTKSIENFSDSENCSSDTEPASNLHISFPSSNNISASLNQLVEDSAEKDRCFTLDTYRTPSQIVCSNVLNSEYSSSDDELIMLGTIEASQSEKPSKYTSELKNEDPNISSLKSNQLFPALKSGKHSTPSKVNFHKLSLQNLNTKKRSSLKTNSPRSVSINQMQLTSFFMQKTPDNQLSTVQNVESNKTIESNVKSIVSKPLSQTEKNIKPVMNLEQFKMMFTKKTPSKKPLTKSACNLQPPIVTITKSVELDKSQQLSSCPFYKKMPDTAITVDAFKYGLIPGCRAYFLSHFHYDHYQGMTKHFKQSIYCSQVTANLIKQKIGVSSQYLHPLPLYCPVTVEGVNVTLLDANHCPGATMILLKKKDGKIILHTGDFRADSVMEDYAALKNVKIHQLYLDTTYCNSSYTFPSQKEVLDLSVSLSLSALQENPKTLIVVGSYTIGKEKVFLAIAETVKSKIGVTKEKKRILDCQENSHLNKLVSLNMDECMVHVVKMNSLNYKSLSQHLAKYKAKFDRILAFKPTGWTHSDKNKSLSDIRPSLNRENIILYGLPYSEHSSYTEMKRFIQFIQPEIIIPTVNNGSPSARKAMKDIFKSWLSEKSIAIK